MAAKRFILEARISTSASLNPACIASSAMFIPVAPN
jgi:hypothetical protein